MHQQAPLVEEHRPGAVHVTLTEPLVRARVADVGLVEQTVGVHRADRDRAVDHARPRVRQHELHLDRIGAKLTVLTDEQSEYIGVPKEGPYKPDQYRY